MFRIFPLARAQEADQAVPLREAGTGTGSGTGTGTGVAPAWTGGMVPLQEQEVIQAIRLLTRFGQVQQDPSVKEEDLQKELSQTDPNTRLSLQQLLGSLAARATSARKKILRF